MCEHHRSLRRGHDSRKEGHGVADELSAGGRQRLSDRLKVRRDLLPRNPNDPAVRGQRVLGRRREEDGAENREYVEIRPDHPHNKQVFRPIPARRVEREA